MGGKSPAPAPAPVPLTDEQLATQDAAKESVGDSTDWPWNAGVGDYEKEQQDAKAKADAEKAEQERLAKIEADKQAEAKARNDRMIEEMELGSQDIVHKALTDPTGQVTSADVSKIDVTPDQTITTGTGQVGQATTGATQQATPAAHVVTPDSFTTATMTPTEATGATQTALSSLQGVQGQMDPRALVEAVQKDPSTLSQLGLDAAQIQQITQIISPDKMQVGAGELITSSPVDMARVQEAADIEAAQAQPSKMATVQGELEKLYSDFDATSPPPWAAGAMRAATAKMAQRGLAASSIAGQAIVQGAMESALPIAMADAQIYAQFEGQNLSNRQQAAMFAAEQRVQFLGMEYTQEFQGRVANAARIADVANMNFTAEQQIALENARLAQTADLANLNARQAKVMADAAAMSQLDLTNLSHQQQVGIQNAQSFLQMDLTNLNNLQQTELFKAQSLQQSILSDAAAKNAASQFNAASENQTNQFMANMEAQVQQFNASQANAMAQFNVNEANAMEQFNASQVNARDQFNAQNSLIIAQANAKWRQDVATMDTAAQNEANMEDARMANAYTAKSLDQLWQRERDQMDYAYRMSESSQDRALQLVIGDKQMAEYNKQRSADNSAAIGGIAAKLIFGGLF